MHEGKEMCKAYECKMDGVKLKREEEKRKKMRLILCGNRYRAYKTIIIEIWAISIEIYYIFDFQLLDTMSISMQYIVFVFCV